MTIEPHLFFSQAVIDLDRVRFQTHAYTVHQVVADLFGDREGRGYLFYEVDRDHGRTSVLILSKERPASAVASGAPGSIASIRTKPFELDVAAGTVLDYEIRINATRVVTEDGRKRRADVWDAVWEQNEDTSRTPDEVYEEYLARKLDGAAEVLETHVVERGGVTARASKHRKNPIFFRAATLIGTIRVSDTELLSERAGGGIGRAKAFGCGLLCLSRPGTVLPRRYPEKTVGA